MSHVFSRHAGGDNSRGRGGRQSGPAKRGEFRPDQPSVEDARLSAIRCQQARTSGQRYENWWSLYEFYRFPS